MSIQQCLADRVNEGAVFEIRPLLPPSKGQPRSVWAEKEVFEQLSPATARDEYALESGRMRRKLEAIVSGNHLVIGNRRDKNCDIKRLEPFKGEVWELRERDRPSIRIFFRFIELDCLATTNLRFVKDLFGIIWFRRGMEFWPVWRLEIRRCKATWRKLFHTYSPHTGEHLNDYLTNSTGSGTF